MNFLNNVIRVLVFIIWAFIVFNVAKLLGFEYAPEESSAFRNVTRVVLIIIILGGFYFIRKVNFIKKKEKK